MIKPLQLLTRYDYYAGYQIQIKLIFRLTKDRDQIVTFKSIKLNWAWIQDFVQRSNLKRHIRIHLGKYTNFYTSSHFDQVKWNTYSIIFPIIIILTSIAMKLIYFVSTFFFSCFIVLHDILAIYYLMSIVSIYLKL